MIEQALAHARDRDWSQVVSPRSLRCATWAQWATLATASISESSLAVTLVTLTAANLLATVARFLLLRHWVFRP